MKSKTKTKKQKVSVPRVKARKYAAHYLALILVGMLVLEGGLMSATTKIDWKAGVQILDVSAGVQETISDTAQLFQPLADAYQNVNEFYILAATEMAKLLDMHDSFSDVALVWDGVNDFYQQASVQMAQLLDMSSKSSWPAMVSGLSIQK